MSSFVENALNLFMARNMNGQSISPVQQNYINVIKNNDVASGEQIATNLCNSMGMSKEQAIAQARQYFGI